MLSEIKERVEAAEDRHIKLSQLSGFDSMPYKMDEIFYIRDCNQLLDLVERLGEALEECYNAVQKSNAHLPSGDESEVEALLKELEPTE